MPRDKKPEKARNKKYADPKTGAFRHSDGDRRHRHAATAAARDAVKLKKLMQELGGLPSEESTEGANDGAGRG